VVAPHAVSIGDTVITAVGYRGGVADERGPRWFEPYLWAFAGGFAVGLLYALITRPRDAVVITESWSYVPKDQPWTHGILLGVTLALVYGAIMAGLRTVQLLFRHGMLFTVGGGMLIAAALFFIARAITTDEGAGGRVAWLVMGLFVGGLGVPMVWTERRAARR
jgi:hypothetical protein